MRKKHCSTITRFLYKLLLITTAVSLGLFGGSIPPANALVNRLPLGDMFARVDTVSAAGEGEWTQEAHDAQRSGYTAEEPAQSMSLAWTWNGPDANGGSGNHIYNAPPDAHTVTGGSFVYVPAGSNGLYALNKSDGGQAWRVTPTAFNATPAYDPSTGALFAGGADGRLYKFDSTSGQVQGAYVAGSPINKAVTIAGGSVYVTSDNGELHKVNPGNMSLAWKYAAGAALATPPAYSAQADLLVYATEDLYVHAVRASDGTRQWRVKPTSHDPSSIYTFSGFWPVIAEQHGIVFVRLNLGFGALFSGNQNGTGGGGVYPSSNAATRDLLLANNGALENLFALDLANGSKKFVPAVGYGAVEYRTSSDSSGLFLVAPPVPVIKVNSDGSEVAYIAFRSGQGQVVDGRWDSHMGEMVLDNSTISGLQPGDLRFVESPNSYTYITDEQVPFTMAGNVIFHAHWGASDGFRVLDRSSGRGLNRASPITAQAVSPVVRRAQACSDFNSSTHQTSCGLNLVGDGHYWGGPAFWTYWNVYDPPTQASGAYSDGARPRYTYYSSGLMVVEGNGGELTVLRSGGGAPAPTQANPTRTPTRSGVTNTPAPTSQGGTWTFCANEGGTCSFPGAAQVRYGANGSYAYQTATNSIACTNAVFGDPAQYQTKTCEYQSSGGAATATKAPTGAPTAVPTATRTPTRAPTSAPTATRTPTNLPTLPTSTTVPPQPTSLPGGDYLTLDSYEDFTQTCAVFSNTHASDRAGGVVEMAAQVVDPFSAASISTSRWTISSASASNGAAALGPNASLKSKTGFSRSNLEASATFERAPGQMLGFTGSSSAGNQYFYFSTANGDGNLYALANNQGAEQRMNLGSLPTGLHRYRIEWTTQNSATDSATFFVDGVEKVKLAIANTNITGWRMYAANTGSGTLLIDSIQSAPAYLASGIYYGCKLDAGVGRSWSSISWDATKPANTSLVVKTRNSTDGTTWSAWSTVSASGYNFTNLRRYVQFNLTMNTANNKLSSTMNWITLVKSGAAAQTSTPTQPPAPTATRTPTQPPSQPTATRTPTRAPTQAPTGVPTITRTPTRTSTPAQSGNWTFCANEGGTCSFSGTTQVRFGANGSYAYRTATNSIACTNAVFGDPAQYQAKTCEYLAGGPTVAPTQPGSTNTPAPTQPGPSNTPAPTQPGPSNTPAPTATALPSSGRISNVKVVAGSPAVYEKFEVQFSAQTSATNLDLPYDTTPPAGVTPGAGITVNGLFSSDNWATTITQPGFLFQPYNATVNGGRDHFSPAGAAVWAVRFAPQKAGAWQYRLSIQDNQGTSIYPAANQPALTFNASASSGNSYIKKGFITVSQTDSRYFQFKDGTPFLGSGFNDGYNTSLSTTVEQKMVSYEQNKMNFMRVWLSGSGINGSQWPAWASHHLPNDSYLPGVSFDTANTYNGSLVSWRLDDANPCQYADFWRGDVPVDPNTTYQLSARVKLSNVSGPSAAGDYGFVIKHGGWLGTDCAKSGVGTRLTAPVNGTRDWTVINGTYTTGSNENWVGGLYLTRENASGGQIYIDEVHLYRADDASKTDLLRQPYANVIEHFDTMSASQWDMYIQSAEKHGVYLKLVVDEKNEWIRNRLGPDGKLSSTSDNNNFYAAPGTKVRWLEQAWWRYLIARWGYSTAIHSFEYINEGDPYNGNHYEAAGAMAKYFEQNDPSNHMVTTSFWHSFPNAEFWSNPAYAAIDYADVHAYISTGWGEDASFIPTSMQETTAANVHTGKTSARLVSSQRISQTIVPRGLVIQGQGEWVIKYWMKASGLSGNCSNGITGSQVRVRWTLDGGAYGGGMEGVVPTNSQGQYYVCTSVAGTFDWRQFSSQNDRDGNALPVSARIIVNDNEPHELNLLLENPDSTGGTAWMDDVQLINPSGQVQPIIGTFETTKFKEDSAWSNIAYGQIFGGGGVVGVRKPLVRAETGLDDGTTFDPDILKDTKGIWLHNNVWAQVSTGSMSDMFWWVTETIPQSLYANFLTYQNFMAGIPISNGRYRDSGATASHPDLRVVGQRDDTAGQMHLWIQNTQHSWRRVVNGPAVSGVTGAVTIPGVASGSYRVEWWNTYNTSNPVIKTETISCGSSNLVLTLPAALVDDIAIKITKLS